MPNWVTNRVSISGKHADVDAALAKLVNAEGKVDFNLAVPQPDSLNITSGTSTDVGIWLLTGESKYAGTKHHAYGLAGAGTENLTREELLELLKDHEWVREGRVALENRQKYAHQDWYSWSIAMWGTKWNACRSQPVEFTAVTKNTKRAWLVFETAWSAPDPVLRKVTELVPGVTIKNRWQDEGGPRGTDLFVSPDADAAAKEGT